MNCWSYPQLFCFQKILFYSPNLIFVFLELKQSKSPARWPAYCQNQDAKLIQLDFGYTRSKTFCQLTVIHL